MVWIIVVLLVVLEIVVMFVIYVRDSVKVCGGGDSGAGGCVGNSCSVSDKFDSYSKFV